MAEATSPRRPKSPVWNFPKPAPAKSAKPTLSTKSAQTQSTSPVESKENEAEYSGADGLERVKDWARASSSEMSRGEIDWENGDYFMACTMKQLRELDSEAINEVRVIKSYIGPSPSPAPERKVPSLDELPTSFSDVASDEGEDADDLNAEPVPTTPNVKSNYQVPTVMTADSDSEDEVATTSILETNLAQKNYQAPSSQAEASGSKEDHGTTPFPDYNDEDARAGFANSDHGNEETVTGNYGADPVDEENTIYDPTEPEMNEFRLNPNRPDIDMTPEEIANYADYVPINFNDPEAKRINARKMDLELARTQGTRNYGFQVVGTNLPYTHNTFENMSDYYRMPLIEFTERVQRLQTDEDVSKYRSKRKPTVNLPNFLPKQTQPAAMSLVLYLTGKGMQPKDLIHLISTLDPRFVDELNSRYFNGCRIPEHWEMNTTMVEKILVCTKALDQWCEGVYGSKDKAIMEATHRFWFQRHENRSAKFVRSVLENYIELRAPKPAPVVSGAARYWEMIKRMKK